MKGLPPERYQRAHHSFVPETGIVDVAVLRSQAQDRAMDKIHPEDTVVHLHPYDENWNLCNRIGQHEYYWAEEGLSK